MELTLLRDTVLHTSMPVGDDESIDLHYRIGALGADFDTWISTERPTVYVALARACTAIDITVDGVPVACTPEGLEGAGIPLQVLHAILAHVRAEATGGKLGAPIWRSGLLLARS